MTPIVPVRPDAGKIFELIRVRDHGCTTPRECPHQRGAVTRFARRLGRHRQTLWNIKSGSSGASLELLYQIATALKVDLTEIIQVGGPAGEAPPGPQAEAA